MPNIFKKFDADGNGELGMDEFIDFISRMKVGIKPSEASDLFLAFDTDGSGGIDEKEFMKTLFPVDYRRIYRRASNFLKIFGKSSAETPQVFNLRLARVTSKMRCRSDQVSDMALPTTDKGMAIKSTLIKHKHPETTLAGQDFGVISP